MIILSIFLIGANFDNKKQEINEWAKKNNYRIEKSEWQMTPFNSPFYYVNDGEYVWKVNVVDSLNNPHVWWVRTSIFGNDYEEQKN